MATKLTQQAMANAYNSKDSLDWLMQRIQNINRPDNSDNRFKLGGLYFFGYDAKGKDKLKYWDKFPLVLALESYSDGFLGLNLHYLPVKYRVAFLDKLMDFSVQGADNEMLRLRITYDILQASKRLKEFKPCVKRYLSTHIQTKLVAVKTEEWKAAAFLPVQHFTGASDSKVWQESLEKI